MEPTHDLTADGLHHPATHTEPDRGYMLAHTISNLFHPVVLSMTGLLVVGAIATPHWLTGIGWALLCMVLQITPGALFFMYRLRQGVYSDEDVSIRQQRHELYLFTFMTLLVNMGVLVWLQVPVAFVALLFSVLFLIISAGIINIFWKISVHASSAATCATVALLYSLSLGTLLWLVALLVGWSRVRTGNHTVWQVLAGLVVASSCVLAAFALSGLI